MKQAIVEIAAQSPARFGRAATMILLAGAAGCAGGGARTAHDAAGSAPALPAAGSHAAQAAADSALVADVVPKVSSSAADLTRWSASAYEGGRHVEAIALLSPWLAARADGDPAAATVRAALAIHHEALGQPAEAAAALADCDIDAPAVARARTWLHLRGDGFDQALVDAQRAVEAAPASAADRNNHGIALLYAGRPAEAREAFLAAHELDPALPGALYNLAIVESVYYFDDRAARRWLDAYRRLSDEDPDGVFGTIGGASTAVAGVTPGPGVLP